MRDPKIKKYNKDFDYSYAFGIYPTLDLLKLKPEKVLKVLIKQEAFGSDGVEEILEICKAKNIKYEIDDHLIEKLAIKENTYTVGIFEKYQTELTKDTNHVVLVEPRNMGNMGTIIRTMVGFGIKDLAIVRPAADIFDPLIVRSAMGAFFSINFKYYDSFQEYFAEFPEQTNYMFMLKGAKKLEEVELKQPFSLVFGNESTGLPYDFSEKGISVFIPHNNEIDSLNLSVAVGIALYKSSI
ncbi:MAG TPA: TrmH family RNA methyltransferase [Candidatus Dojkabacteria bacterium]|nr:TrmH family RNA methyltransferase [Candidatus Dojkabacteria bacterium]